MDSARSYLFVPANRPDRFSKALSAGADAVIIDLEDAVTPDQKDAAREILSQWLATGGSALVRINGPQTEWFHDDLQLCGQAGVAGTLLPKAQTADDVRALAEAAPGKPILPLIETALGFSNVMTLCAQPAVQRLVFGAIDFQVDLGIEGDGEELLFFRSQLVLVSRLHNLLPPVDGVTVEIHDSNVLRSEARRARRLGFGAKLCIHPKQVDLVNELFSPSTAELAWAQRVLDALARNAGNAVALDGKLVDTPVVRRAEAIMRQKRSPN